MAEFASDSTPTTKEEPAMSSNEVIHPLQQIYDILSRIDDIEAASMRPIESKELTQVRGLMSKVQIQHLGIPMNAMNGRLKGCYSLQVALMPNMFEIAAFVLPRDFKIHLHDHPSMTVCSKLLLGEVHIRSFSREKRRDSDSTAFCDCSDDSGKSSHGEYKASEDSIECTLCISDRKTYLDEPWLLTPDDGNFHEITAITNCILLDILLPPYDNHDRNCTFYQSSENMGRW
eukprot:CAMPEP_0202978618 /NCGR_PEP_ID=MMETSP1396-20130829/84982_1 /ASSEMBLY_ACC=CAM_ASM_000872 /TAXON_ID= /ORGANISM="Pseudokeronopsis sp., Strain Brazil" /LENGTH=230 /DNA_ID=CAMNT_0049717651 /DNA_START=47 /DNA_END=736 /DNA_ORIENTATION=-